MTTTVDTSQSPDVGTVLRRFNQQLSRETGDQVLNGDMLDRLTELVRYQIVGPMIRTDDGGDLDQMRTQLREQQSEAVQLANELAAAQARVAELEASPRRHRDRHLFPVDKAGARPGRCECGERWPGDAR